jgi:hypothetical protein
METGVSQSHFDALQALRHLVEFWGMSLVA